MLPLSDRRNVSIKVRNFETSHLKVNDADGNPIEIAAIVVWQVADTSRALYAVEDYLNFVRVQAASALRHVATTHPYDEPGGEAISLRGSTDVVARELAVEMAERVAISGVEIVEVRISHLATRTRSPRRCAAASRQTPPSLLARGSSRARSGWSKRHSSRFASGAWSPSTRNARRRFNAHVEMLLRRALSEAGRMPKRAGPLPKQGRPPTT